MIMNHIIWAYHIVIHIYITCISCYFIYIYIYIYIGLHMYKYMISYISQCLVISGWIPSRCLALQGTDLSREVTCFTSEIHGTWRLSGRNRQFFGFILRIPLNIHMYILYIILYYIYYISLYNIRYVYIYIL